MILLSSFWWLTATIVARRFLPFWLRYIFFSLPWLNFKTCHFGEQYLYFAALQKSTSRSSLGVSVFPGSAIRRLTGGECGPCIGAARSVALVTLRVETCVSVSILYLCCLGRWWLWELIRFRRKMKMLPLIARTVGGLLPTPMPLQSKTL